jgi:gliding motility-associated-like protein
MLFCCEAKTQTEYITNGSFEDIDSCYGGVANLGFDVFEWTGCKGWSNPIYSSSDLWCANPISGIISPPYVAGYFQYPKSGNNFAGIYISFNSFTNYREYIQNQLSNTLKSGHQYNISFYVNQGLHVDGCSPIVFGIKFFNQRYNDNAKMWLTDLIPDAINDYSALQMDTLNWQKVSFTYAARGDENYMIIGNFEDSLHLKYSEPCDTTGWGNVSYATNYYLIDDVSVIELPFVEPEFPNIFTPNGDGNNDNWHIELTNYSDVHFFIYNRWGNKIYETSNTSVTWDSRTTSGEECSDGIYYYVFEAISPEKEKKSKKGFIQLIR